MGKLTRGVYDVQTGFLWRVTEGRVAEDNSQHRDVEYPKHSSAAVFLIEDKRAWRQSRHSKPASAI